MPSNTIKQKTNIPGSDGQTSSVPLSSEHSPITVEAEPEVNLNLNLVLLWIGQFISNIGDWCLWVAIPITVYNSTGSRIDLAFTAFTEGLPYLIFSPIAGVLVDRFDRKKTMIAADIGRAGLVALLIVPHTAVPLWLYFAVLFMCSALSAFFMPARIAVMSQVVPRRELMRVNAILSTSLQVSEAIGPAIGGIILAVLLQRGAFIADAISFLISAVCIAGLSVTAMPDLRRNELTIQNCVNDLKAGVSVLVGTPVMRGMLICWNVGYFASAIFTAILYAFARDILHLHAERYGFMLSLMGIGFLTGGLMLATLLHKLSAANLIVAGLLISSASCVGIAIAHNLLTSYAALFIFGFGGLIVNVPAQTLVQQIVPREMMGRFSAAFSMVARVAQIAGSAAAGFIATAISISMTYDIVAGLFIVSAVLAAVLLHNPPDISPPITLAAHD